MKKPTSTQLCGNCDKQIAGFFKTCPFCKNKIAKPLAEKTPATTDGGAINLWTGAPDKPTPKVQKSETYSDKPLNTLEQNASRLAECNDCKEQISVAALACPHCGAPRAKTEEPSGADILKGFVVLIVIVFLLYQCGSDDEPKNPVELTAAQIEKQNEYKAMSNVRRQITSRLRDPDSYQVITGGALTRSDGSIAVMLSYRAKNGFGGYAVNHAAYTCKPRRDSVSCTEVR